MNIRSRMLKVANNLMEDLVKSFEMTEEEWKKYSQLHPNAKRENHQIVPDRKNQGGNGGKKENVVRKKYSIVTQHKFPTNNMYYDYKIDLSKVDPETVSEAQRQLTSKADDWRYRDNLPSLVKDKYMPVDYLEKFSEHYDENVRAGVAINTQTPEKILEKLSKDKSEVVRKSVAQNICTPVEILENLLQDKDPLVRHAVYFNPNATQDMIDRIEKDREIEDIYREHSRNRQLFRG